MLADELILQRDFLEWAPSYDGRRFNFGHFDFPFGINHHSSGFGSMHQWQHYLDTSDLYWALCTCLLENLDRLFFPSAHFIFWLSMKYYSQTVEMFESYGLTVRRSPLVWHKSDNKGIISDPDHDPRHTYECALLITRGERKLVRPVADSVAAQTQKSEASHVSEKPETVLRHFFRMCVDDLSEVLDPTCGSGTSIVAAEEMGANRIQGLDISEEVCETARARVRRHRKYQEIERHRGKLLEGSSDANAGEEGG